MSGNMQVLLVHTLGISQKLRLEYLDLNLPFFSFNRAKIKKEKYGTRIH
jgi:hypothetical protein